MLPPLSLENPYNCLRKTPSCSWFTWNMLLLHVSLALQDVRQRDYSYANVLAISLVCFRFSDDSETEEFLPCRIRQEMDGETLTVFIVVLKVHMENWGETQLHDLNIQPKSVALITSDN